MTDLINVTVADGKYTIRQDSSENWMVHVSGGYGPADDIQIALATEVDRLHDQVEGLNSDLDSAVEVAFHRGATDWVRLNYPTHFDRLSAAATATALKSAFAGNVLVVKPGDKFVVRFDGHLTSEAAERIQAQFKEFAGKDAKLLVFDKTADLSILRVAEAAEKIPHMESRDGAHAGSDPALGAEATAGTDAGGTAALPEIEDLINLLLERDADKIRVVNHFPSRCGLEMPMNDVDDGEMLEVAALSLEDSGYAPALWNLAIAVLKSRRATEATVHD